MARDPERQLMVYDGPGRFAYAVVGESHHNGNLRRILTAVGKDLETGGEYETLTLLERDRGTPSTPTPSRS